MRPGKMPGSNTHEDIEILLLCDDPEDMQAMEVSLTTAGYRVSSASDPEIALKLAGETNCELAIVDIGAPSPGLIEKIRADGRHVLLVSETSRHQIDAANIPADDYITKPVRTDDLLARVAFLLTHSSPGGASSGIGKSVIKAGDLEIDFGMQTVHRAGRLLELSRTDWVLLAQLARRPGQPVLDQELLVRTWGPEYRRETAYLMTYVSHLRKRLGDTTEPYLIRRFHDVGYLLATD